MSMNTDEQYMASDRALIRNSNENQHFINSDKNIVPTFAYQNILSVNYRSPIEEESHVNNSTEEANVMTSNKKDEISNSESQDKNRTKIHGQTDPNMIT